MEKNSKKLWCLSYEMFSDLARENKWNKSVPSNIAIISIINSKDSNEGEKHICKNADNVLNLTFDDSSPVAFKAEALAETFELEDGRTIHFFTQEMAKKSIEFIKKNKGKDFYIHCSAGISRSQAFIRFIGNTIHDLRWETNPNNPCLFPNGFVYQRLMEAYREDQNK